jgi:hypothetical protein
LTKFFDGLIDALKTYHNQRSALFPDESRQFERYILCTVLLKRAHWSPSLDLSEIFNKLSRDTNVTAADKIAAPLADKVHQVPNIQSGRGD